MYTVTSSAGLHTTAETAEQSVTALGQHLHELAADGPIDWVITTPDALWFTGHLSLHGLADDGFIDEALETITEDLTPTRPTTDPA